MSNDVLFVSCTRGRKEETKLFRSLSWFMRPPPMLFFEGNRGGLSTRYNSILSRPDVQDTLIVFAHDDLQITDHEIIRKISDTEADIIGIVGSDAFTVDPALTFLMWNSASAPHLSGQMLGAKFGNDITLNIFGPAPRPCVVMDGMLLAMRPRSLKGIRFDERFTFHFYDLDFCLTAIDAGLALSTSSTTAVIHFSQGAVDINDTAFMKAQRAFVSKWQGRTFAASDV